MGCMVLCRIFQTVPVPYCSGSSPGSCPRTGNNQCDYTIRDRLIQISTGFCTHFIGSVSVSVSGSVNYTVLPCEMSAGNWKQRLLPPPVGMIRMQSFPVSVAFIVCSCSGRNVSMLNTLFFNSFSFWDHLKSGISLVNRSKALFKRTVNVTAFHAV